MDMLTAEEIFRAGTPNEIRAMAMHAFTARYKAGDAYAIGGEDADPNLLADVIGGELLVSHGENAVAVYRVPDGRAVLVARRSMGLWAVDILPASALDEMVRPGGTLMDDQDYETLQIAAEEAAASASGLFDPLDRVLGGPESDGSGPPHIGSPMEDSELPTAPAETVRDLLSERADAEKRFGDVLHPPGLDEKVGERMLRGLEAEDEELPPAEDEDRPKA